MDQRFAISADCELFFVDRIQLNPCTSNNEYGKQMRLITYEMQDTPVLRVVRGVGLEPKPGSGFVHGI